MKKTLKKFIEEINPFEEFDERTSLLDEGILDSLSLVILIEKIEKEFNIEIPQNSVTLENFDCIDTIESLVKNIMK